MKDLELTRYRHHHAAASGPPNEAEGRPNPSAIRSKDGRLYLFSRLVAKGNLSRIGTARILFDSAGDPRDVERMGIPRTEIGPAMVAFSTRRTGL
ncbi:hypothetical protein [Kaistia granuli]|uniref:hypothetical protein n=1 Tax=Kaistia granuli TaxID=363259 RepID=UPI00036AC847|nr:hypothetical protein [Kaistia granuli]